MTRSSVQSTSTTIRDEAGTRLATLFVSPYHRRNSALAPEGIPSSGIVNLSEHQAEEGGFF